MKDEEKRLMRQRRRPPNTINQFLGKKVSEIYGENWKKGDFELKSPSVDLVVLNYRDKPKTWANKSED
jgi:hypothetical protein